MLRLLPLSLCLLVTLSGCMTYSSQRGPQPAQWPPAAASQPPLRAQVSFDDQHYVNGSHTVSGGFYDPSHVRTFKRELLASGRFRQVTERDIPADVHLEMLLVNYESGSEAAAMLTGASFFLLPSYHHRQIVMRTVLRNAEGRELGRIEKAETLTTWLHLIFIVTAPFNVSLDEVVQRLTRRTLDEAIQRKLL